MRQVPKKMPLLVGDGSMATHWSNYLQKLSIEHSRWSRRTSSFGPQQLDIENTDTIYLAVSDDAIVPFFENYLNHFQGRVVHFSGSVFHPKILGCHPLMTFGPKLYDVDHYKNISLVFDDRDIPTSLAQLPNPKLYISGTQKNLYHALCVVSGNFPQMLWQQTLSAFEDMGIPKSALKNFLETSLANSLAHSETALTGPIKRQDRVTMNNNEEALKPLHMDRVYQVFADLFQSQQTNLKSPQEVQIDC